MKKFLLLYVGKAPKFSELTPEQINSVLGTWEQWNQSVGSAVVDKGTMIADDVELMDNGEMLEPQQINGYAMIQAEDMPNALKHAHSHPFLGRNQGSYSIVILELMSGPPAAYAPAPAAGIAGPTEPAANDIDQQQYPETPNTVISPQQAQQPAPAQSPGELTITHEQAEEEQVPPAPGQPGV